MTPGFLPSRAYAAQRRQRTKEILRSLRSLARGSGWRFSRETLLRERDGWFYAVRSVTHLNADVTTAELFYKPMEIDRLFWEITGLPENNSLPLSFRAHGAWICATPAHDELRIFDAEATTEAAASEIIRWTDAAYAELPSVVSVSSLIEKIEEMHLRMGVKGYFPTHICALILSGRIDAARAECEGAIQRNEAGGFSVAFGPTFPEMALDWIVRREAR